MTLVRLGLVLDELGDSEQGFGLAWTLSGREDDSRAAFLNRSMEKGRLEPGKDSNPWRSSSPCVLQAGSCVFCTLEHCSCVGLC